MPNNGNPLGNIRIGVSMNSAGFTDSLTGMKKQMRALSQEMKMQLSAYDRNDKSLEALENRHKSYSKAAEVAGRNVDKLKARYEQLSAEFGENSEQAQKAASELNAATAQYNTYARQLQAVEADLEDVNNGTRSLKESMSLLSQETRAQVALLRSSGREAEALEANIQGLNREVEERNQLIDKEKQKLQQLKQQYGENSREVREQILVIQRLETANNEARNSMNRLEDQLNELGGNNGLTRMLSNVQEKAKALSRTLATTLTPAIAGIGTAAAKVAMDADDAFTKMQNSMGLTVKQTEELKGKARSIYRDGYGESMSEVTDAIAKVKLNMKKLNEEDLSFATKSAMNLAHVYDSDIGEVTRSAQNLMKNFGLSAEEAFDMLTKSGQEGLNFSDELFDNVSEYSGLWKNLGFSAEDMFGTLIAGSKEGVYNLDYLNDMVKEFGIRLVDGSKSTQDAMTTLFSPEGFFDFADNLRKNGKATQEYVEISKKFGKEYADSIVADLKKGGTTAEKAWNGLEFNMGRGRELIEGIQDGSITGQAAMKEIGKEIASIKDPIQQTEVGVALFGR